MSQEKDITTLIQALTAAVEAGADLRPIVALRTACEVVSADAGNEAHQTLANAILAACDDRILDESPMSTAQVGFRRALVNAFSATSLIPAELTAEPLPKALEFLGSAVATQEEPASTPFVEAAEPPDESLPPIPVTGCIMGCDHVPNKFRTVCPQGNHTKDMSLLEDFVRESFEHLDNVERELLQLQGSEGQDSGFNAIFRSFHTIKGVAAFLGFQCLKELTHLLETLVDRLRTAVMEIDSETTDLLLDAVDFIKAYLRNVERQMTGGEETKLPEISPTLFKLEERVHGLLQGRPQRKRIGEILVESGASNEEQVADALHLQEAGDSRPLGEILRKEMRVPAKAIASAARRQASSSESALDKTIRIPVDRLDQLIDAVGEVGVALSMFANDEELRGRRSAELGRKITRANMLMRQVQDMSFSLRMVSVKSLFQKTKRLVYDLSRSQGKPVDFVMEGENTEIDKSMVERLADPLVHLVRNCIDHGIEKPEERQRIGKPATGRLLLRAYHKSGSVFVDIQDDGKGLDAERIRSKAVERGLISPGHELSEQELHRLIFHPGFSTAATVTDLSGRGVGMDVVKQNIEALNGIVDVHSRPSEGTTITLRLPLTLANVNGMVVRLGEERYILPTLSVMESLQVSDRQLQQVLGKGRMLNVRKQLTPIHPLEELVGAPAVQRDQHTILLLEDVLGRRLGVVVDEIQEQQNVVIKQVGEGLGRLPVVAGGAILSDGKVCLILDINGLAKMAFDGQEKEQHHESH